MKWPTEEGRGRMESEGLSMEVWDGWRQEKHREIGQCEPGWL